MSMESKIREKIIDSFGVMDAEMLEGVAIGMLDLIWENKELQDKFMDNIEITEIVFKPEAIAKKPAKKKRQKKKKAAATEEEEISEEDLLETLKEELDNMEVPKEFTGEDLEKKDKDNDIDEDQLKEMLN